ncbi:MAG TPA: DUF5916 domain-containing protein [Thermoanaerobaculia bacterium]|nr:DUF5916 domain-containing protein [Thermoanaerobaculia bacterium]
MPKEAKPPAFQVSQLLRGSRDTHRPFLLAGLLLLAAVPARPEQAPSTVVPIRFDTPPAIDGRLDDPIWQTAARLDGFRQLEPHEGEPATEPTEVFLGYDQDNLYIGARCHDSQPDRIVTTTLTRDSDMGYDDTLQILFDTYHDGRTAFLFTTNSGGVQVDALVRNEGEQINYDWDGIWTVEGARDASGWTVELAIPWRTLRFPDRPEQVWGFNVERSVARKQEKSHWQPMQRAYGFYARYKISQLGALTGLAGARQGSRFHFAPYLTVGGEQPPGGGSTSGITHAGGDLKVTLTSDLVADLTYKTDFSETEADEADVNLTRNPLLFPEKRAFFLEGASLFYFGDRPLPHHVPDESFLFFSRRIGLTEDGRAEIPLLGGVKLTGHQGDYALGVLSLQTEATRQSDGFGGLIAEPRTTYSVARVRRDLGAGSVGVIGLSKDAAGERNRVGGVDWDFALHPNLRTGGYFAKSSTPGITEADWAGSTDLYWDSRNLRFHYTYRELGEGFNDELGYVVRTGVRHWRADNNVILWPERGPFQQAWFTYDFDYITDRVTDQLQTRINNLQANAFFRSSAGISYKFSDELEVLTVPLEIKRGLFVPAGSYRFDHHFVGFQTDYTRPLGGAGRLAWGDYYDGHFLQAFYFVAYRPIPGLFTAATFQQTQVRLQAGRFNSDIMLGEISYAWSSRFSIRTWGQWARGANLRTKFDVNWEFRPGSKLYVVYQNIRSYVDFFDPRQPLFGTPGRSLIAKTVFLF